VFVYDEIGVGLLDARLQIVVLVELPDALLDGVLAPLDRARGSRMEPR
jgi:hypothetical protein